MTFRNYFFELNNREKKEMFEYLTDKCKVTENSIRKYIEFPTYGCPVKNQEIIADYTGIARKDLFPRNVKQLA